ncbi:hypothetical protein [Streptococcus uberis]|uniref:hypothetical protein n=1 Tax=Streptococcus uberis TaxID=1349 RepID=UPI000E033507|nr:hypothetical protein [Streptococcus uberis]SUO92658.1 Uncharacterised protein [Streptococcus uberis]
MTADEEKLKYIDDLEIIGVGESIHLVIDGLNCLVRRVDLGHLCGYAELPIDYTGDYESIECHGGITYYGRDDEIFPTNGFYIGFDTAHYTDWNPWMTFTSVETYKDFGFVVTELVKIAKQVKAGDIMTIYYREYQCGDCDCEFIETSEYPLLSCPWCQSDDIIITSKNKAYE